MYPALRAWKSGRLEIAGDPKNKKRRRKRRRGNWMKQNLPARRQQSCYQKKNERKGI